jgi:excisionase family DNA binding protein
MATTHVNVGDAAKLLGLCRPTVSKLFDQGQLTGIVLGGNQRKIRRISLASIQRYRKATA